ncbi:MAG: DUF6273 domain-containing protein [Firmicutes bacterium]|nr:DUF6273 domain-containing protein [Bacillota bacterium]
MKKYKRLSVIALIALLCALALAASGLLGGCYVRNRDDTVLYTVTFDSNGGNSVGALTDIKGGNTISAPASPTKTGYTFDGWYKEAACNNEWVFASDKVARSVTLYAKWTVSKWAITYANTFSALNENPAEYSFGDEVVLLPLTRAGYDFVGWESEAGVEFTGIAKESTGAITLAAVWSIINYEIEYLGLNGATNSNPATYTIVDAVTLVAPGERAGYTFEGWSADGTISIGSTGKKTFTAYWTPVGGGSTGALVFGFGNWDGTAANYNASNGVRAGLLYVEFGEFPKSYVGNTLNTTLNTAYNNGTLQSGMTATGKSYTVNTIADTSSPRGGNSTNNWIPTTATEYSYGGSKYVRKLAYCVCDCSTSSVTSFIDGSSFVSGTYYWFKVEPIRWLIGNWAQLPTSINPNGSGTATTMQLVASEELMAGVPFYHNGTDTNRTLWANSTMRSYLNNSFINEAFDTTQRAAINTTSVPNNTTAGNINTIGDGVSTSDKIFLPSYYEVSNASGMFYNLFDTAEKRQSRVSDFALANFAFSYNNASYMRMGYWWLRSAYSSSGVLGVNDDGRLGNTGISNYLYIGVRLALVFDLSTLSLDDGTTPAALVFGIGNWDGTDASYAASNGVRTGLPYVEFGEYPKTYVGDTLNATLNTAYNNGALQNSMTATGKSYTVNTIADTSSWYGGNAANNWIPATAAEYSYGGSKYVRKLAYRAYDCDAASVTSFIDGSSFVSGTYYWFMVMPIRWLIGNWAQLPASINPSGNGTATTMQLVASEELMAGVPFYHNDTDANYTLWANSTVRTYLNGSFINEAFDSTQRAAINTTSVPNNTTAGNINTIGDGVSTSDKIFLPSYYEVSNASGMFNSVLGTDARRQAWTNDWAIANYGYRYNTSEYGSIGIGMGLWWLRSAYSSLYVRYVHRDGGRSYDYPYGLLYGVRPALVLALS